MPSRAIAEAKALLDARENIIKSHDQANVDAWRLAIGRAIDKLKSPRRF